MQHASEYGEETRPLVPRSELQIRMRRLIELQQNWEELPVRRRFVATGKENSVPMKGVRVGGPKKGWSKSPGIETWKVARSAHAP